jgi:pimeloyl-ACP methyl ester carboxylesterase
MPLGEQPSCRGENGGAARPLAVNGLAMRRAIPRGGHDRHEWIGEDRWNVVRTEISSRRQALLREPYRYQPRRGKWRWNAMPERVPGRAGMPFAEVRGARIHYTFSGLGRPAFVFVHGGCCGHRDWVNQVRSLNPGYMVVTLDLQGHGLSTGAPFGCRVEQWAADVTALIDMLQVGPVVLTGHRLASRIVVEAACRRPDNVGGVVLLDGSRVYGGFSSTEAPAGGGDAPTDAGSLADVLNSTIGPYADPATRAYVQETMSSAPPGLMKACVDAIEAWDRGRADVAFAGLRPDLPVLAIQSTYHDRFTPRYSLTDQTETTPYLDFVKAARAGVQVKILTGAGHFSMLERADEVTSLIRDFGIAALSPDRA